MISASVLEQFSGNATSTASRISVPLTYSEPPLTEQEVSSETITVVEHERQRQRPSPELSLVVLERKVHKEQTQLEKTLGRLTQELPLMSEEEKELVRRSLQSWCDRIQQTIATL